MYRKKNPGAQATACAGMLPSWLVRGLCGSRCAGTCAGLVRWLVRVACAGLVQGLVRGLVRGACAGPTEHTYRPKVEPTNKNGLCVACAVLVRARSGQWGFLGPVCPPSFVVPAMVSCETCVGGLCGWLVRAACAGGVWACIELELFREVQLFKNWEVWLVRGLCGRLVRPHFP